MQRVSAGVTVAQKSSWHLLKVTWHWVCAPLVDHWKGLSLTRFIAIFCCGVVYHECVIHENPLDWVDVVILTLAIVTTFGKSAFLALSQRVADHVHVP
jgi:hypothetical protein